MKETSRVQLPADDEAPGDIPDLEFREAMARVASLSATYLEEVGSRPVFPDIEPGHVKAGLAPSAPKEPESLDSILDDYVEWIEPNVTHWNHPAFFAYFAITGSRPGVLGETLAASLNVNAMLWRSSPAATELEESVCDWLRQMLALPDEFRGHINDTASISTMLALACAREETGLDVRQKGMTGRSDLPLFRIYCSDQAHSSVAKSAMTLGLGLDSVCQIACDDEFRLDPKELESRITADLAAGHRPIALVASAGTTSTTSVDPIDAMADLAEKYDLWFHVDGAYAGSAAICPEIRQQMKGLERADSFVVNPHKWLFTQVDCSVLFMRDPQVLKGAFSLVPPYLRTEEDATNLMDLGVQLGRRFRALKLWFVLRRFGVHGLQERIRYHCDLARWLAEQVSESADFVLSAPVPFSTVCLRFAPVGVAEDELDELNDELVRRLNKSGSMFLGTTNLKGRTVIRVAIGNLKTKPSHLEAAWRTLQEVATQLVNSPEKEAST